MGTYVKLLQVWMAALKTMPNPISPEQAELANLRQKVAALEAERELLKESVLRAQAELSESRERIGFALASARVSAFDWDILNNTRVWADNLHQLLGTNPETFSGTTQDFLQIVHPEDRTTVQAALVNTAETAAPYEVEYRAVWPDKSVHHIAARGRAHRDGSGRVVRMTGICWDITEQKKKEQELLRLNRTLKALKTNDDAISRAADESEYLGAVCNIVVQDCGHAMVWIGFAEDDEKKSVRPAAHAGFDAGYLETMNISWAEDERGRGPTGTAIRTAKQAVCRNMLTDPQFAPWREQAIKRGYASSVALPLMSGDRAFGAITVYSREPDPFSEDEVKLLGQLADDVAHGIATIRLRAAKVRAEEEAHRHREWLQVTLTSIGDAVITTDTAGRITFLNPVAAALTDWEPQAALGQQVQCVFKIIGDETRQPAQDPVARVLNEKRVILLANSTTLVTRKNREVPIEDSAAPIKDSAGKVAGVVLVFRDVTDKRRAQTALLQSREELERLVQERTRKLKEAVGELEHFSYTITHDMRAPLRAMRGYSDMLLDGNYSIGLSSKAVLERIASAAERMDRLITDALNYSSLVRQKMNLSPVDVSALIRELVESYPNFQQVKGQIFISPSMPVVFGNQAALTQCFSNLLGNAIKFASPGKLPEISVWAEDKGELVRFWVKDNGIGIAREFHERIFGMFQRLSTQMEGTGIGLALVKKAAERMGGRVGVESEPGHGARFWLDLRKAA